MTWPLVKLGDVAPARATKNTFSESEEVWTLNLDQVESGTGKVIKKIAMPISEIGSSTHGFDERHVLYSKLRPYLNKVVLPDSRGLATTELVPLLPDPERLDREYLAYYLRSKRFVDWVSAQVAGAKMPRVSMQLFWEHEIPLPPLDHQKRIAATLYKADAIRRKRQQAIQLADEFLRAVFLDMFGDPVINPKGWSVQPVKQVCSEIVDCVNRTAPTVDAPTPYKMIRTTNVRNYSLDTNNVRYVTEDTYNKWTRRLMPEVGDVIFTREAPAGEAAIIETDEKVFLGQRTMHFRPKSKLVSSDYLIFELMGAGVKRQITKIHSGSTVTHLSVPECKEFGIRIPPFELQKKFESIRRTVQRALTSQGSMQEIPLYASISQSAFNGDL